MNTDTSMPKTRAEMLDDLHKKYQDTVSSIQKSEKSTVEGEEQMGRPCDEIKYPVNIEGSKMSHYSPGKFTPENLRTVNFNKKVFMKPKTTSYKISSII